MAKAGSSSIQVVAMRVSSPMTTWKAEGNIFQANSSMRESSRTTNFMGRVHAPGSMEVYTKGSISMEKEKGKELLSVPKANK